MKNITATICLTLAVLLGSSGMSWGAHFRNCEQEYKNNNYDTAIHLCRPFAEQGNPLAQHKMGWMYGNGNGVPQDYKTAVKWYKLAAEQRGMPLPSPIWVLCMKTEKVFYRIMSMPICGTILPHHLGNIGTHPKTGTFLRNG
jgi:hypothetical protein